MPNKRPILFSLTALLIACGHTTRRTETTTTSPTPTTSVRLSRNPPTQQEPSPAPTAAAPLEAPAPAPAATTEPAAPVQLRRDAHYPATAQVELGQWLAAHAVKRPLRETQCWDAAGRVGVPNAAGLVCFSSSKRPTRTVATIYRLDGKSLVAVWRATIGTHANWLELTPVLAQDGASLELLERAPGDCEGALAEYHAKQASGVAADFGEVLTQGCAGRGRYVYRDGRYVRDLDAKPPAP